MYYDIWRGSILTGTIAGGTILLILWAVGTVFQPRLLTSAMTQIALSQGDQQKCSAVQISQMDTLIFLIAGGPLAAMGFVESSKKGVLDFKGEGTTTIKAISFVPVLASVLTMIGATTTRAYASVDCSQSDDPRCQKDVAFCIAAGSLLGIWILVAAQAAPFVCQVLQ